MPRPRKITLNNTVLFVTSSVEEGLMLPPNPLIRLILLSCLSKAQHHHPVTISHFVVEATHIHMLLYVTNPDDVKGFMERFKTESAHAINRLLGRRKSTLWCEGYDSPIVLDVAAAQRRIIYIYENPSKDSLVDSIDLYPGLSSWSHFKMGAREFQSYLVPRDCYRQLPEGSIHRQYYQNEARRLRHDKQQSVFKIEPNAWMQAFGITDEAEQKEINQSIVTLLKEKEQSYKEERAKAGASAMGANKLMAVRPGTAYTPERSGKRTYCVAEDRKLRQRVIGVLRGLMAEAREALLSWRRGIYVPYPVGLYPPSFPKVVEAVGAVGFIVG